MKIIAKLCGRVGEIRWFLSEEGKIYASKYGNV